LRGQHPFDLRPPRIETGVSLDLSEVLLARNFGTMKTVRTGFWPWLELFFSFKSFELSPSRSEALGG